MNIIEEAVADAKPGDRTSCRPRLEDGAVEKDEDHSADLRLGLTGQRAIIETIVVEVSALGMLAHANLNKPGIEAIDITAPGRQPVDFGRCDGHRRLLGKRQRTLRRNP